MTVECYAQRLLNPFRGAMHTIKYASAEAVTTDGVHWDIYVANDRLLDGLDCRGPVQISDIRYGSWSVAQGLKRGPLHPSEDFRRLEDMGATVYEHLTRLHDTVPFAFKDRFELWLLDAERLPLALLDSAVHEHDLRLDLAIDWRAGFAARERFRSPAARQLGGDASAAEYLTGWVNGRAGREPAAQWFRRERDGSGAGLQGIGSADGLQGRGLDARAFPPLFLTDAADEAHRALIADFHAWQAAWLLVLPDLDPVLRGRLEGQARVQSQVVETQHRLYPELIDAGAINAARVEARLRRGQQEAEGGEEAALSTYYIELNETRGK